VTKRRGASHRIQPPEEDKGVSVQVRNGVSARRLREAAHRRNMSSAELGEKILFTVLRDNLVAAVLDDEGAAK
jgi:hypothetical protein